LGKLDKAIAIHELPMHAKQQISRFLFENINGWAREQANSHF
jgi:hypothetical protein